MALSELQQRDVVSRYTFLKGIPGFRVRNVIRASIEGQEGHRRGCRPCVSEMVAWHRVEGTNRMTMRDG